MFSFDCSSKQQSGMHDRIYKDVGMELYDHHIIIYNYTMLPDLVQPYSWKMSELSFRVKPANSATFNSPCCALPTSSWAHSIGTYRNADQMDPNGKASPKPRHRKGSITRFPVILVPVRDLLVGHDVHS